MSKRLTAVRIGEMPALKPQSIPRTERMNIAQIVEKEVNAFFEQPGMKEEYEQWLAERRAAKTA